MINEGESIEYECVDGYARMTNVTCLHGSLTALPLCEPSKSTIKSVLTKNPLSLL